MMDDYVGIIFDLGKRRESVSVCALNYQKMICVAEVAIATVHMGFNCKPYVNNIIRQLDTLKDVSYFSKSFSVEDKSKNDFTLYAANDSKICSYFTKLLTLDLGFKCKLQWPIIIVVVTKPIMGTLFLETFWFMIDLK